MPYQWVRIDRSGSSDDPKDRLAQVQTITGTYHAELVGNTLYYPHDEDRGDPWALIQVVPQNDEMLRALKHKGQPKRLRNTDEEKGKPSA